MKAIQINKNNFYTEFIIFNEYGRSTAIVKVDNASNTCYEVEMLEKVPVELLSVYDFIKANWR